MRTLTEEEFKGWKADPVTQAIVALLQAKREELKNLWEGGSFADYTKDGTVLTNVGNLGTCKGYAFLAELTYEDYLSEIDDGEPKRLGTEGSGSTD